MEEKTVHRIDKLRVLKDLPTSDLEKKLKYSNGGFGKALRDNASMKDEKILLVLELFPEVDLNWLLTGKGVMLRDMENDPYNPDNLGLYLSQNHEKMMNESKLYNLTMQNLIKDGVINAMRKTLDK